MAATTRLGLTATPTRPTGLFSGRTGGFTQSVSDTLDLDAGSGQVELLRRQAARPLAETLPLSETLVRAVHRGLQEALGAAEALTPQLGVLARTTRLGLTATPSRQYGLFTNRAAGKFASLSESLLLGESSTRALARGPMAETLALAESLITAVVQLRTLSPEAVTLGEALSKLVVRATIPESLVFVDGLTRSAQRQMTEALAVAEQIVSQLLGPQGPPEILDLVENLGRVYLPSGGFTKALADTLPLTETLARETRRLLPDSLGLSESLADIKIVLLALPPETVDVAEALTATVLYARVLVDVLGTTESLVKTFVRPAVADVLLLSESLTGLKTQLVPLAETLDLAEVLGRQVARPLTEALGLSESTFVRRIRLRALEEALGLTESLAAQVGGAPVIRRRVPTVRLALVRLGRIQVSVQRVLPRRTLACLSGASSLGDR